MFLLSCNTCDRSYHMQCLQPPAEDKPKSAWQCSFCLNHYNTTNNFLEKQPYFKKRGRKKSCLKNKRYTNQSNIRFTKIIYYSCRHEK